MKVNPNIESIMAQMPKTGVPAAKPQAADGKFGETVKALEKYVSQVDELQRSSDVSVQDLLAGKNDDIASVVSAVAKADISFKLLVGVRNKMIEAYKQTMNMQL